MTKLIGWARVSMQSTDFWAPASDAMTSTLTIESRERELRPSVRSSTRRADRGRPSRYRYPGPARGFHPENARPRRRAPRPGRGP
jgi:hypothetical protein